MVAFGAAGAREIGIAFQADLQRRLAAERRDREDLPADWSPVPDVELLAFAISLAPGVCE